jgi:hypothetical protein
MDEEGEEGCLDVVEDVGGALNVEVDVVRVGVETCWISEGVVDAV